MSDPASVGNAANAHGGGDRTTASPRKAKLLKIGALQEAIFNSANFSSIATDERGVIQIFNVGAERMLGYAAADVVNLITPADISDPQELIARAAALSVELDTPITPGFEALVFKASRGIEDIYELTYVRKDGSRFPAIVSVTALRDDRSAIIGYLLIGTDNTVRHQIKHALQDSEERYTTLFNTMFEGFCIVEVLFDADNKAIDYRFVETNKAFELQTGLVNPKGKRMRELAPDHEEHWFEIYGNVALTGEPAHFVNEAKALNHWYEVSAQRFGDASRHSVSILFQDVTARMLAEEALLKAGALQSAIFNSANFSSIATDAKGVIQIFNVGAERMLGYAAADVVNKITPADISDPQEVIARAEALSTELGTAILPGFEALVFKASRGIEDIYELSYIRKDGSRFPAIVSVTALRDAQESIIGYLLIGTDNSARKRAEQALIEAGALQSAIFNSANFSSIATDAKGVIQIFNVGAERMLGYAAADVVNKITPADISDPQEVIARAEALSQELGTTILPGFEALVFKASRGIEDIYELTYIRKDRSRFPAVVSVTALRDPQENIIGYLLIGTDNTARKEVEAAQAVLDQRLRDQQFYTRSLIESNIDALMTTDPQGFITDVNQQMIALTGCTRDELIGAPCKNFFTDPARAEAAIRRVLTENKVSNYELTVRSQDGTETVVSYNAATFHNRGRKLQGVFAAARDVTELKRFERALQEKNIELEHASRMKSEFLATMSHELRTPLNAIIGFSEALKDGLMGELSATQNDYIGDIFTSGQHLLSLINDILDLSKVEAGMMTLELESIDLKGLLSNSLSIVKEKAATQRIRLEVEIGDDLDAPQLDVRKTKQIVYNLLSNAVKFSASGGRVVLRARRVPRSAVGILAGDWPVQGFPLADSEYNEFLEICVADTGIGISRVNMAKLFQAFTQIDSSLARKFEGTGLGLAMVKQLAELHAGTVAVASAEDAGARFAVWLPLRTPAQVAVSLPQSLAHVPPSKAGTSERIALIVEDDDKSADLVRVLLEAEGFTVLRAASAEAALLMAPKQALSLITLDLQLPGIDGWEFLLRIRESIALARVPVVIVAGMVDNNLALTRGAAAVLQKPISRTQLKTSLANLGLHPTLERTHTVLVVDDDPKSVEVIAAFLQPPDYAVVRAYGGGEAIILAQRLRPDLILLDLMMPDVSGFDVVEALQRNNLTACIPILVVTAKQITDEDRAALSSNPDNVIRIVEKAGFNQALFVDEVRRALLPH